MRRWKKVLALTVLGLVGVAGLLLVGGVVLVTNPVSPRSFGARVEVDPAVLRADVEGLVEAGGYRHFENVEGLDRAADFIRGRLEGMGYPVADQLLRVEGRLYRNLVTDYGREGAPLLVVGAHYDVCGDQPGADDNASGVAGLLAVAALLREHRPALPHRVELVAYTLEEPPFFRTESMGSSIHARSLSARGIPVRAAIVLEMLGFYADAPGSQRYPSRVLRYLYPDRADFVAVVGRFDDWGLTRAVKASMAGACAVPVRSINAPAGVPGVDFSDHLNYWREGFSAVMVSDTAFYRNPNYHQPTDHPESLDFPRMAEVVKGVYAAVVTLD